MLEKVLIFIIFLGPLVFFHELGHFLFARLFGVRVETFSIGFGPKLFSFKKGDTVYALSLIPLGGYVKMFGDDPLSEEKLTEEEEAVAYTKKSKWARFWIVFGGPLANFILAFFIYVALTSIGEKLPQPKFGKLESSESFYSLGFRTGDILTKINEQEISSFDDFNLIDTNVLEVTVQRTGEIKKIKISIKGMDFVESFAKVSAPLRSPILVDQNGKNFLIKIPGELIVSLEEILEFKGAELELFKIDEPEIQFQAETFSIEGKEKRILNLEGSSWKDFLIKNKLYPRDLFIKNIMMGSAAEAAKLKKGDLITQIDDVEIYSFNELKNAVQSLKDAAGEKKLELGILNSDGFKNVMLMPQMKVYDGVEIFSVGVESGVSFFSFMVEAKSTSLGDSLVKGFYRTKVGMVKTLEGFKKLITGEVSLKHVGGPIAIGQVASDSFNISLSMFFRLMAIISINLGIINLFPIPVLDGGHIVFILLEAVNRGPLSRKKMMYAQQLGMSLLFLLIFVALFNDISRLF